MRDDDDLPVLSAVVRGGDAAVIRSARLGSGRDARRACRSGPFAALDGGRVDGRSRTDDVARIDLGRGPHGIDASDELDDTLPLENAAPGPERGRSREAPDIDRDGLDDLVEEIVERHVAALRREVRDALERAFGHAVD